MLSSFLFTKVNLSLHIMRIIAMCNRARMFPSYRSPLLTASDEEAFTFASNHLYPSFLTTLSRKWKLLIPALSLLHAVVLNSSLPTHPVVVVRL